MAAAEGAEHGGERAQTEDPTTGNTTSSVFKQDPKTCLKFNLQVNLGFHQNDYCASLILMYYIPTLFFKLSLSSLCLFPMSGKQDEAQHTLTYSR